MEIHVWHTLWSEILQNKLLIITLVVSVHAGICSKIEVLKLL
jgi:hypothetical protein